LVALGLHTLLTGAAESLPMQRRGVVALRILGYLVALTFVALAVAVIAYGGRIW
jgi:Na+/H+-dicarboxylate symporter